MAMAPACCRPSAGGGPASACMLACPRGTRCMKLSMRRWPAAAPAAAAAAAAPPAAAAAAPPSGAAPTSGRRPPLDGRRVRAARGSSSSLLLSSIVSNSSPLCSPSISTSAAGGGLSCAGYNTTGSTLSHRVARRFQLSFAYLQGSHQTTASSMLSTHLSRPSPPPCPRPRCRCRPPLLHPRCLPLLPGRWPHSLPPPPRCR